MYGVRGNEANLVAVKTLVKERCMSFKAERISESRQITLNGDLKAVFPLFGPIEESKWAPGWAPNIVSPMNVAIEEHMIFTTKAHHGQEADYTWIVSKYDPERAFVEYTVFAAERLWWITILCRKSNSNDHTEAEICYTFAGLTDKGNMMNRHILASMFAHDLKDWEDQINYYIETGHKKNSLFEA